VGGHVAIAGARSLVAPAASAPEARMPLDRVHRVSLAHSVGAQLCRAIVSGDIPAGTQLSEPALAARLGVSRAPIREAQG
jgi:DNA-binding GntR family transcriptional regulator